MRSAKLITILCGGALVTFAQEYSKQDVSVQALGSFVKSTSNNGVEQSATNSGGVLASYRYFFNKNSGVEISYAFTTNTQSYGSLGVDTHSNETSAAYVFRLPLKHLTPFLLAGAGGIVFDPKDFAGDVLARPTFVYGAGADFDLGRRFFLRAQYRGLVYNSPTLGASTLEAELLTHRAEPSAGFGFRF